MINRQPLEEGLMKYRIFTYGGDALPIAHKLQQEGCEVIVGMVQDKGAVHSAIDMPAHLDLPFTSLAPARPATMPEISAYTRVTKMPTTRIWLLSAPEPIRARRAISVIAE